MYNSLHLTSVPSWICIRPHLHAQQWWKVSTCATRIQPSCNISSSHPLHDISIHSLPLHRWTQIRDNRLSIPNHAHNLSHCVDQNTYTHMPYHWWPPNPISHKWAPNNSCIYDLNVAPKWPTSIFPPPLSPACYEVFGTKECFESLIKRSRSTRGRQTSEQYFGCLLHIFSVESRVHITPRSHHVAFDRNTHESTCKKHPNMRVEFSRLETHVRTHKPLVWC